MEDTPINNINLVLDVLRRLNGDRIEAWVFGGWAEELQELIKPRVHQDIDLLYQAEDFSTVEKFIDEQNELKEIKGKQFHHKRAFRINDVMVEITLVKLKDGSI